MELSFILSDIAAMARLSSAEENQITVLAAAVNSIALASRSGAISIPLSASSFRLPAKYRLPSWLPLTPAPVMLSKSLMTVSGDLPRRFTTASARGCSDRASRADRIFPRSAASFSAFRLHTMSVTDGLPSVTVPVLSRTTESIFLAVSMLSASLMSIPLSAPFPIPTIMAVGVARPRAQGQAMMSTVTIARSPWVMPFSPSRMPQRMNESKAMPMMTGTNTAAILSTSFCTGALLPCASWTMAIIFERRVSVPTLSARNMKLPFWLIVPANTFAPGCFATGTGSPLSMLSST